METVRLKIIENLRRNQQYNYVKTRALIVRNITQIIIIFFFIYLLLLVSRMGVYVSISKYSRASIVRTNSDRMSSGLLEVF